MRIRNETARGKVLARLSEEELLCQLAEDRAELAKAALKARRGRSWEDPTTGTLAKHLMALGEEWADVDLVLPLVRDKLDRPQLAPDTLETIQAAKLARWADWLERGHA